MFGKLAAFPPFFYILGEYLSPARDTRSASRSRSDFSTLIINDSPIHQQRSGQPSKASRSRSYSRNRSSD
ncbi:hypothetical protein KEM48_010431 [Puccinia striiformis f. sp. tritici PST-130]|nr:hypothetical protein KEM48_010431 [Puccinia striiformis f. sp. tritici PST-130]